MTVSIKYYNDKDEYWSPIATFFKKLGLEPLEILDNIITIERQRYEYVEVFSPTQDLLKILEIIDADRLYSLGLYVGMMRPGEWFKPSLPLAHKLAPYCNRMKCIVLDYNGEKFFLYGKTVYEENIVSWNPGVNLVVNELGEALGWGVGKIANIGGEQRRVVEPIWDMGWYLRRGG